MKALLAFVLLCGTAYGQALTLPVNQFLIPLQASANGVDSFTFVAPSKGLYSLTVVVGASAGFVMVFDAVAKPANGAVTPLFCMPVAANDFRAIQWMSPIKMDTGATVVFSTGSNCDTLTASATAKFMGQAL